MDLESYVLSKKYTDKQISSVGAPLKLCGSVPTYEDLPTEHAQGDVWHVIDTGAEWAWAIFDGEGRWENIGLIATDTIEEDNPSPVSSGGVYEGLQEKVSKSTTIAGVDLQDNITVAELLAGLGMNNWNNTVRAADVYKNYKDLNSPHDFPHGIFLVEAGSMANTPSSPAQNGVLFNLHTHKDSTNHSRGVQIFIEYLTSAEAGNRGYSSDMYIRNVIFSTQLGYVYDNYNGGWQKLTNRVDLAKKISDVKVNGSSVVDTNKNANINLKTINGQNIMGEGNVDIRTYQAMPDAWLEQSTMAEFIDEMWDTPGVVPGMAYVGTCTFTPMPVMGEVVVEIISDGIALFKLNSADTSPYNWYYNTWTEDFTWKEQSDMRYGYFNEGVMYKDPDFTETLSLEPYILCIDKLTQNIYYAANDEDDNYYWKVIGSSTDKMDKVNPTGTGTLNIGENNEIISENGIALGNDLTSGLEIITPEIKIHGYLLRKYTSDDLTKHRLRFSDNIDLWQGKDHTYFTVIVIDNDTKIQSIYSNLEYDNAMGNSNLRVKSYNGFDYENYDPELQKAYVISDSYPNDGIEYILQEGTITINEQSIALGDKTTSIGKNSVSFGVSDHKFNEVTKKTDDTPYSGVELKELLEAADDETTGKKYRKTDASITALRTLLKTWSSHNFALSGNEGALSAGKNNVALGIGSIATGRGTLSLGKGSFSSGNETLALGHYALAHGMNSRAYGYSGTAIGRSVISDGYASIALGYDERNDNAPYLDEENAEIINAHGDYSVSIGHRNKADGRSSISMGEDNDANNDNCYLFGKNLITDSPDQTIIGNFNDEVSTPNSIILADGTGANDLHNAIQIRRENNTSSIVVDGNTEFEGDINTDGTANFNNTLNTIYNGNLYNVGQMLEKLNLLKEIKFSSKLLWSNSKVNLKPGMFFLFPADCDITITLTGRKGLNTAEEKPYTIEVQGLCGGLCTELGEADETGQGGKNENYWRLFIGYRTGTLSFDSETYYISKNNTVTATCNIAGGRWGYFITKE